ncbi:CxxxxCH/CxxCH domain-containing protein [Geomonas sp. Red421]|uniref:CxxxxCH/CxxCH domain-containing protein n=2 Tax=Geomonas anaerohicana TaxID=2798583 RepID=A0ABS0YKY6_9BACT|nr:CxxxxCH/CxxCH domain-containing protein [Geomonas anaerohicana]
MLMTLGAALLAGARAEAAPQYDYGCDACHTMPPLDSANGRRIPGTGAFKGNHGSHADSNALSCVTCHGSGVLVYQTGHRTDDIKVSGNINGSATGSYSRAFVNQTSVPPTPLGSCSNVNCHFERTSPEWGSTAYASPADCNSCHGSSLTAGHPVSGSKHGTYYGTGTGACVKCHTDHSAEAKPFAHATSVTHRGIALNFTVTAAPNNGGSYSGPTNDFLPSQSNTFGTCSGLYCHSDGTTKTGPFTVNTAPAWGNATLGCNGCHGGPATLGSPLGTGKHQAHINNPGALGSNYGCVECHAKTAASDSAIAVTANHVNTFVEYSGAKAGKNYSGGSCSNTYCHTSGKKGVAGVASTVEPGNPSWSGPAMVCNGCHGAQPMGTAGVAFSSVAGEPNYVSSGLAAANSHEKHVGAAGASTCNSCHAKTTTTGTSIVAGGQHIDGFINYTSGSASFGKKANKTCSNISCHSGNGKVPVVADAQWGATLGCNGCHGGPVALGSNVINTGAHTQHTNQPLVIGDNMACAECHAKTVAVDTAIATAANHMNNFVDYSGVRAGKSGTLVSGTCSATYCHTSGKKGQTGMVATVEPANPSWSGPAMGCNGCHGAKAMGTAGVAFTSVAGEPNYVSSGLTAANSHEKHVGAAGATTCATCHSKTTTNGTSIIAGSQHLDRLANYTSANGSFAKAASKSCSNITCHSGNGKVSGVFDAQWGTTLGCNGCHGGPAALGTRKLASGKHAAHMDQAAVLGDNLGCVECHSKTVSSDSAISTPLNHLNSFVDYSGVRAGRSTTYSGGTCSASYCHTSGKKGQSGMVATVEPAAPSWSGPAMGCNGCHGAKAMGTAGVAFNSIAGEPNYVSSGLAAANSHEKHVGAAGASTCSKCHAKTTANGTTLIAGNQHLNGFANYTAADLSFGKKVNKTCSNISCHSGNGKVVSVADAQWGASLGCNGCHGGPAALGSNIINTGAHNSHINQPSVLGDNLVCAECHSNTVSSNTAIGTPANHMNAFVDYSGAKAGKRSTVIAGTCSATYCHTSGKKGQAGMVATVEPAAPNWSGPVMGCNGCHGAQPMGTAGVDFASQAGEPNYVTGGPGAANANSHKKHVGAAGATTCSNCHSKTTTNGTAIIAGSQHLDRLANYTSANGSFGKVANKTCSNITCHSGNGKVVGVADAQWGDTLLCNGCHGGPAALGTRKLNTGSHAQHMDQATVLGDNLGCVECHSKTVSSDSAISTPANHLNNFVDYSGAKAGRSTTYSGGTCSATYCHTSGKKGQTGMVATVEPAAPSWGGAAMGCSGCHGAKAMGTAGVAFNSVAGEPNYVSSGLAAANSHEKHVGAAGASTCVKCHAKTTSNGTTLIAGNQHLNGFANYTAADLSFGKKVNKTCSNISCHSSNGKIVSVADAQWGVSLGCNGCHGGPVGLATNRIATGAHAQHTNQASVIGDNLACVECHANTVTSDTTLGAANHMNNFVDYSGVRAGKRSTVVGGTCSATYCHTSGKKGQPGMVATIEPAAPNWSGTGMGCTGCHGAQGLGTAGVEFTSVAGEPNYTSGLPGTESANSHKKHVGSGGAATCVFCHSKTTSNGIAIISGSQHLNGFNNFTSGGGKTFYKRTNKTCSNISCHSGNGKVAGVADAQWGATLNCNGCHGGPVALGTNILATGSHPQHVNTGSAATNYGCVECHAQTVSSDTQISNTLLHADTYVNYSGVKAGKSSTYVGGVCSASYCHSSGKKGQTGMVATVEPASPSWGGTALGCNGCHGAKAFGTAGVAFTSVAGEPNYTSGSQGSPSANSHQKHVRAAGAATCVLCHSSTVDATGTQIIGNHTNKVADVLNGGTATFGYPGGKTCTNVSCHAGTGYTATNAVWGATLDCKGCHATLSGAHTRHVGTAWGTLPFYNYTANLSSGSDTDGVTWRAYGFGCANCHPVTLANHMNGSVEVELNTVTGASTLRKKNTVAGLIGSTGLGTVACSNVYCHADTTTPQWNQTYTAATRCSGCHENAPSTDSHAAHAVGIHYDDIFSGTSGLLPAAGAVGVNAGHGDPAQSTTIGCNICHYTTVNVARNKYNSSCSTVACHGNTTGNNADALGASRITNLANHVNGRNDIAFVPNAYMKSKAQVTDAAFVNYTGGVAGWNKTRTYKQGVTSYDTSKNYLTVGTYSNGSCSNIVCHSGNAVHWVNDFGGARDCTMCHLNL